MICTDETQRVLREKQFITDQEVAMITGDLVLAENVITKDRRILDASVRVYLDTSKITESKTKSKLLKG